MKINKNINLNEPDMVWLAKTLAGLEDVLALELRSLGARNVETIRRGVIFEGDFGFMYKAHLWLGTALRILMPIARFRFNNPDDFYHQALDIRWEDLIQPDQTFAVDAVVFSEMFSHSGFAGLKLKDAIVDRQRKYSSKRSNVALGNTDVPVHLHIADNEAHIYLDASGESLHKRGYRKAAGKAPLSEVLAHGMLRLAHWRGETDFLDPMCGSGTLAIEAALIAYKIPPGIFREKFAFMNWRNLYDEALHMKLKNVAMEKQYDFRHKIIAADRVGMALRDTSDNIKGAMLQDLIETVRLDFFETQKPLIKPGLIVINPPYGERLDINVPVFYKSLGDVLKNKYQGSQAWVISSEPEGFKAVGLKPDKKHPLKNGNLDCNFARYTLFKGDYKSFKSK